MSAVYNLKFMNFFKRRMWNAEWDCLPDRFRRMAAAAPDWTKEWAAAADWKDKGNVSPIFAPYRGRETVAAYIASWSDVDFFRYRQPDKDIVSRSFEVTRWVYQNLGMKARKPLAVDYYNAEDFEFQNIYPRPDRYTVKRVLDFGAGYGRQANLWSDNLYCAIDGFETSYCVQHVYLSMLAKLRGLPLADQLDDAKMPERGLAHLPTWAMPDIPDSSFDMIICSHVLPEIPTVLLTWAVTEFARLLAPGGVLYIRDLDLTHEPGHKIDTEELLERSGFTLEFRPYLRDGYDIISIPRVWRKIDAETPLRSMRSDDVTRWLDYAKATLR